MSIIDEAYKICKVIESLGQKERNSDSNKGLVAFKFTTLNPRVYVERNKKTILKFSHCSWEKR